MLIAYFRDIAHKKTMLELFHSRDTIQDQGRKQLRERFAEFDIECIDVLIGKPESSHEDGKIETLLEQLRMRQLSLEQIETYGKREQAAAQELTLNEAVAKAAMQAELTASKIKISIATNDADADLARARKEAEKTVVTAEAEAKKRVVFAEAESRRLTLEGQGESSKVQQIGTSEADVLLKKVASFGDSRLYAMSIIADALSKSQQPLVPTTVFGGGEQSQAGMLGTLMSLLVNEKLATVKKKDSTETKGEGTA